MSQLPPDTCPGARRHARTRRRPVAALAGALLVAVAGCGDPEPTVERRLLVVDGIEITFADLDPYVEFLASYMPESGIKTRNVWALREHVLPLAVARRTFAAERAAQLESARALCEVATNVLELDQQTEMMKDRRRSNMTRNQALLPVAMFLFDQLNVGGVSQPIELPHGWFVVGAFDYHESPLVLADYVDALQVGFVTHTSAEWQEWWDAEKLRIGQKVTFVHPDYRDHMPKWIKPPQTDKP